MACARRSLTAHLSRRFHLSFAHILRDKRDGGAAKPPHRLSLPSSSSTPASSRSIPGFGFSALWDPRTLAFSLPLGLRGYSSGAEGSNEIDYVKDAEVLTDNTIDIAAAPAPFTGEVCSCGR